METKITKFELHDVENVSKFIKEKHFYKQVTAIVKKHDIITVRFYGTPYRTYCVIWLHSSKHNKYVTGGDFAYYETQAFDSAIRSLGIKFNTPHCDIKPTLELVMKRLKYTNPYIHTAHG